MFGYVCFVPYPYRTKLDPCVLKNVFFGHSRTQKEYNFYCPELDCLIISADVPFFESKPYFDTKSRSSEFDEDFL